MSFYDKGYKPDNKSLELAGSGIGKAFKAGFDGIAKLGEIKQKTKDKNAKFNLEEEQKRKQDKIFHAKAKAMRGYLAKAHPKVDFSKYSDEDIVYAGDMIEKTHTDPTSFRFHKVVYNNGRASVLYKNDKGETKLEELPFKDNGNSGKTTSSKPKNNNNMGDPTLGKELTIKRAKEIIKKNPNSKVAQQIIKKNIPKKVNVGSFDINPIQQRLK